MSLLQPTKAPALPLATDEYNRQYTDQLNNILRIYFTQVDSFTQNATIPSSGLTADRPVLNLKIGDFYFDTTLTLPIWWTGSDWVDAAGNVV
jgi:hypothetical protein